MGRQENKTSSMDLMEMIWKRGESTIDELTCITNKEKAKQLFREKFPNPVIFLSVMETLIVPFYETYDSLTPHAINKMSGVLLGETFDEISLADRQIGEYLLDDLVAVYKIFKPNK